MGGPKKNKKKSRRFEYQNLMKIIAGVDEVGRGSLVGPVYAAAVILKSSINTKLLKDSKYHDTKNIYEHIGGSCFLSIEQYLCCYSYSGNA